MSSQRRRLEERVEIARRDLEELAEQLESGEVDAETAESLRLAYQAELDEATADLKTLPSAAARPVEAEEPDPQPRSPRRAVVGTVLVIAALTTAILFAARDATPEAAPAATAPSSDGLTVDPNSVSNDQLEEVVAANPDINAMRLALADRYFEGQDYGNALEHYLYVADNDPTPAEEGRALSRVGWMAYITGQPHAAEQYVRASLTSDPANDEAKLFLGFILLYGMEDPEAAIPWLEEVAAIPNLPATIASEVETALAEARGGGG